MHDLAIIIITFQVIFLVVAVASINYIGWSLCKQLDGIIERMDARAARRELLDAISHHKHNTDGSVTFRVPHPP